MDENKKGKKGDKEAVAKSICIGLKCGANPNFQVGRDLTINLSPESPNTLCVSHKTMSTLSRDSYLENPVSEQIQAASDPDIPSENGIQKCFPSSLTGINCKTLQVPNGPVHVNVGSGTQNIVTYAKFGVEFPSWLGYREPDAFFVGRKVELSQICDAVKNPGKSLHENTLVITGEGGVGKAETVRKFIQEHHKEYFDKVLWLEAEDRNALNETIKRLGRTVFQMPATEDEKEIEIIWEAIYEKLGETKSLIVFNKVESFRDVIGWDGIQTFLPRSIQSALYPPIIIIISRATTGWDSGTKIFQLETLRTEESEAYLRNRLKDMQDGQSELVRFCANVPAALRHAADIILLRMEQRRAYSIADFLEEIAAIELWSPICELHPVYPPALLILWDKVVNGGERKPGKYEIELRDCLIEYKRRYTSLGKLNSETLIARNHIAFLRTKQGEYKEALRIYKEVFRDRCSVLGPNHQFTLATKHDIGFVYNRMGKYKEALRVYESVYVDRSRYIGVDSLDALITRHDIAYVHLKMGTYQDALRIYEDVYKKRKDSPYLGEDHPDTLTTKRDIGSVYIKQHKYEEALEIYQSSYQSWCNLDGGPENPDALITAHDIAYTKALLGQYEEATSLYEWVYATQVETLGSADHPDALRTRHNIGYAYALMGDYSEALDYYNMVYPKQVQVLGSNHPDTLTTYQNIASVYFQEERYDDALIIYQTVSSAFENAFGHDNPDALAAKFHVAQVLERLNQVEEALKIYEQVWQLHSSVLGDNHPDTLETRLHLERLGS